MEYILKVSLNHGEKEVLNQINIPAQLEDDVLKFKMEDMEHTVNLKSKQFIRENEEYSFLLDIENKKSQITLKKENYTLQVLVEYANLLKNKNEIQLSYFIETDDHENVLKIKLEEGRE